MFCAARFHTRGQPVYVARTVESVGPLRLALNVIFIAAPLPSAQLSAPMGNGARPLMIPAILATWAGPVIVNAWSRWWRLMLGSLPNTGVTVTTVAPGGIVAAAASKDAQTVSPIATPAATAIAVSRNKIRRQESRAPPRKFFMALGRAR